MIKAEQRWFDIPAVLLFMAALWLVGLRIQATDWTDRLSLVQFAMLMAAILGMALGASKFTRSAVIWMSAAFSLIALTWLTTLLLPSGLIWAEKLLSLSRQVSSSLANFFRNEGIRGSLLFMVSLLFAFWWLGFLAGFQLLRSGKPWMPLSVIFVTLLIIDYYPPVVRSRYVYTGLVVLFLFLLLCRLYYLQSQQRWKEKRAMVDFGAGYDISRSIAISASLLLFAAWGIPGFIRMLTPGTTEQQKFVDFWGPLQDRFENMVSDLRAPRTGSTDFFNKNLSLGTEISTEETPIFSVTVSEPRARGYRYYWRGYSYDRYEEGGWSNTVDQYHLITSADWPQQLPQQNSQQQVFLRYTWLYPRSRILYIPGSPLSISREINWVAEDVEGGLDGVTILSNESIYKDQAMQVEAVVNVPAMDELQSAGQEYPDWVTERYLQVPEDLPVRISALAAEITAGLETPFEKAQAVTKYLRDNIKYNNVVEPAPDTEDPVEWFLFETKEGFCNYYASAEVLMLRSLGIPARMAVGFAQGEKQDRENEFLILLKHAHAWPEVYFPGYGWVEFEPTVTQLPPEIYNAMYASEQTDGNVTDEQTENFRDMFGDERFDEFGNEGLDGPAYLPRLYEPWQEWGILTAVLMLISLIFAVQNFTHSSVFDRRMPVLLENLFRRRGWEVPDWVRFLSVRASLHPVARYFSEIPWMLKLLKTELPAGDTPAEQVQILVQQVPEAKNQAAVLLREYEISTFSNRSADLELARRAHSSLWRQVILSRVRKAVER